MKLNLSSEVLSSIIIYMKYARFLPELQRRETWEEIVTRNKDMHLKKFPELKKEIKEAYKLVYDKKILPSMRALQFSGKPIEISPNRQYNCAFCAIDSWEVFSEVMFLLLGGSGVGMSVQKHHVDKLPEVRSHLKRTRRFLINDSIEGWADAIKVLVKSYFFGQSKPIFDFSDIRDKGMPLVTSGGKAPGPQPLKDCLHNIAKIFDAKESGTKLTPLECHDIVCCIADGVLAGGIRRAALISLFSLDDEEMLSCKTGRWWETHPWRARANNSAVILRHRVKEEDFFELWERIKSNGNGEPNFFFTNDMEMATNPCQPADATVLTPDGVSTIGTIKPGDEIWTGENFSKVLNKWSTGIQEVYEYHTRAGIFVGTSKHRIVSHGEKIKVEDANEIDTAQGPCATSFMIPANVDKDNKYSDPQLAMYVMDGLVIGDGSVHKASRNLVGLHIGQGDQDYFNDPVRTHIIKHRPGIQKTFYEINTTIQPDELPKTYLRKIPERYLYASDLCKCLFLRGLYSANGSVVGQRITLKAASFDIIRDIQIMLSSLGINSYYTINKNHSVEFNNGVCECRKSYDLNINTDRKRFNCIIGFIQEDKQNKLSTACILADSRRLRRAKKTYEITNIVYQGKEEVFDLTVEAKEHTYWTGGLLVSNCAEISLNNNQFCNLVTINAATLQSQEDLEYRTSAASFISTLQASYTDFHYLRDRWKKTTEKEALLGISITGIASGKIEEYDLKKAAKVAIKTNREIAKKIGINPAARITAIKPEGTSSCVLGCSSGIHAWHAPYYIRRIRVSKTEPIYKYLKKRIPKLVEDDYFKPSTEALITIPIKAPEGAIYRNEPAISFLERIKYFNINWIKPGHIEGSNTHNVSATVSIKDNEWDEVGRWMWDNRKFYNALTVLPYDPAVYKQPPFEEISEERYEEMIRHVKKIDLKRVLEEEDNTTLKEQIACGGSDSCEIL